MKQNFTITLLLVSLIYILSCNKTDDKISENVIASETIDKPISKSHIRNGDTKLKTKKFKEPENDENDENDLEKSLYNSAMLKIKTGDFHGAIEDLNRVIIMNEKHADAYNLRGYAKYNLGRYNEAITDYTIAIELNKNHSKAYFNRGDARDKTKEYFGAISDYTAVSRLEPKNFFAYISRGMIKEKIKDINGAVADYNTALKISSDLGIELDTKYKKILEMTEK